VILTNFSKIAMLRVVLNRQKISKTILEKAFFLYCLAFLSFFGLVLINFKIVFSESISCYRSYRVSKNREFYADFKKANLS
jgi:hypothetical protein